jgi:hypothetical protein
VTSPKSKSSPRNGWIPELFAAISAVCAIVATVAAVRSCEISRVLNQPFVAANPLQYEDTDAYIKTEVHGNAVRIWFRYEITNKGNIPVRELKMPKELIFMGVQPSINTTFNVTFPDGLTLGPGQSYKYTFETQISSSAETGEELENIIQKGEITFFVRLVLTYFAQVPDKKEFKIISEDEFSYYHTIWLKSEFID